MTIDAPRIGELAAGPRDSIADVAGVTVGHCTLDAGPVQTGVTVVRPHGGDLFRDPLPAAAVVINGFGKSVGLVQVNELGVLETPIALTNTFAVGTVAAAQIRAAVAANPGIGRTAPTVNPLVAECNDGWLNDLQAFAVAETHYDAALAAATADFAQCAVGAGRGMSCFGVKGGIGSASRRADAGTGTGFAVGALVLANFGRPRTLVLAGRRLGPLLEQRIAAAPSLPDRGSIIVVLATDAPLDHRQLRRLATRAAAGIARTGSSFGHGSGDIALAFATAQRLPRAVREPVRTLRVLDEPRLDPLFEAAAEATEQAIVHALFAAETLTGYAGHTRAALTAALPDWRDLFR
jgi:D-aminopeptidase